MSFTVQKWDNNTTEIVYKLYAFDSDFIIQKEVLAGNLIESTYYNSNVSRETIAAAWTARLSKTYDYKLKENLVDNRFNRNFLAFEDADNCSLIDAARKGVDIKVEDFPLLWIQGNGGSGYYDSYTGDTFQISGNGCIYGGGASDYDNITSIDLRGNSLTTDFTNTLLSKFKNLEVLTLSTNNIDVLDISNMNLLELVAPVNSLTEIVGLTDNINITTITIYTNRLTSIDVANLNKLTALAVQTQEDELLLTSISNLSDAINLETLNIASNNFTTLDISFNTKITYLRTQGNALTAEKISDVLIDLDENGESNGFALFTNSDSGSLTTAGAAAKTSLQAKGWNIVGI
jgi:uncharacterized protein YuzE